MTVYAGRAPGRSKDPLAGETPCTFCGEPIPEEYGRVCRSCSASKRNVEPWWIRLARWWAR